MTGMHLFELTFFCILGAGCGVAVVALLIGAVVAIFKFCGIIIDSVVTGSDPVQGIVTNILHENQMWTSTEKTNKTTKTTTKTE